MIVIVCTSISFFVVGFPGNDMEGGGERHPGEPPRTLGQLDMLPIRQTAKQ